MHVQHESMRVREQRHRRVEDAEKRRQYRVAHGLEGPGEKDQEVVVGKDDQSPVAVDGAGAVEGKVNGEGGFVDWEGKKKPVKKWLGIW